MTPIRKSVDVKVKPKRNRFTPGGSRKLPDRFPTNVTLVTMQPCNFVTRLPLPHLESRIENQGSRIHEPQAGSLHAGSFGRWDVTVVPIKLPQVVQFHRFRVAIKEDNIDSAWHQRGRGPVAGERGGAVAMARNSHFAHAIQSRVAGAIGDVSPVKVRGGYVRGERICVIQSAVSEKRCACWLNDSRLRLEIVITILVGILK